MKITDIASNEYHTVAIRPELGRLAWYIASFDTLSSSWRVLRVVKSHNKSVYCEALICYILDNYPEKIGYLCV